MATACCLLDQGANSQTRSKTVISCTNISDKYHLADTFPVIVERVSGEMETPVAQSTATVLRKMLFLSTTKTIYSTSTHLPLLLLLLVLLYSPAEEYTIVKKPTISYF